jgi:hypothetical protein
MRRHDPPLLQIRYPLHKPKFLRDADSSSVQVKNVGKAKMGIAVSELSNGVSGGGEKPNP